MQRAPTRIRHAELEKKLWNPPNDAQQWTHLLSEFKGFFESGIEVKDSQLREQFVSVVDAFL